MDLAPATQQFDAALLPATPGQLDSGCPPHYLALCLLGRGHGLPRPVSADGKPIPFGTDDYTSGVALAVNLTRRLAHIRAIGGCYVETTPHLYRRAEDTILSEWVTVLWSQNIQLLKSPSPKKIKDTVEMIKAFAPTKLDTINRRYIAVAPELFWDTELATLTDSPELPVFFQLFDTPQPTAHYIKIPQFTPEQTATVRATHQRILDYMNTHDGDLPEEFEFVRLWANRNHDLYCDIMKASASVFMYKKPLGAFMPVGLRRNGKTAWSNDFMKTMLGEANTTSVQLSELGDPHLVQQLQWTLYNAPDEEKEGMTRYATDFKTMCDHGRLDKPQLYSKTPFPINCDFVCSFPMNHEPTWEGEGVAALVRRSLILPFMHDFGHEDQNPVPFPERTFTAEMFSHMLGHLFAIATYYRSHPLVFSPIVEAQRQSLEEEADSHIQYFEHFIVWFDGFQSIKQIYEDYQYWCRVHEVEVKSQRAFKLAFAQFLAAGRTNASVDGVEAKVYRIRAGKEALIDNARYSVGTPASLHALPVPLSVVERKEAELEKKYGDRWEAELTRLIAGAKAALANATPTSEEELLNQPPLDDIFN